jgi:hypothetical protein
MVRGDKAEFLQLLRQWASTPAQNKTTGEPLRRFLLWYFSRGEIEDSRYSAFLKDVPHHLIRAFEMFSTSTEPDVVCWRQEYLQTLGEEEIPNLLDIEFGGIRRALLIQSLCYDLAELVDAPWFQVRLESTLKAQDNVLAQRAFIFAEKVYRNGLFQRYEESKWRGMSGMFGRTQLRAYTMAGRISLGFARPRRRGWTEHYVGLVGGDELDTEFGVGGVTTDVITALQMMEDVIRRWPTKVSEQRKVFRPNRKVKHIAVAMMEAANS